LDCVQDAFLSFLKLPQARLLVGLPEDPAKLLAILARNIARNRRRRHDYARPHLVDDEIILGLPSDAASADEVVCSGGATRADPWLHGDLERGAARGRQSAIGRRGARRGRGAPARYDSDPCWRSAVPGQAATAALPGDGRSATIYCARRRTVPPPRSRERVEFGPIPRRGIDLSGVVDQEKLGRAAR
jgi:hypothetical protein